MTRARLQLLLALAVLSAACGDDPPDCASICYEVVTYGVDATGGSGGDPECEGLTSESCADYCELAIGGEAAVLSACDECVRGGDNYCGSWSCNDDCGGFLDAAVRGDAACYEDADGDGYGDGPGTTSTGPCAGGESSDDGDCDDADAAAHPGADEVPGDGVDQDCTGLDADACYEDADGDGYGAGEVVASEAGCAEHQSGQDGDCDDGDTASYPGADEVYDDGVDQDCVGGDIRTCYYDLDGDGYGSSTVYDDDCCCNFIVEDGGDCDDGDAEVCPSADEVPGNGIDDDCDGETDEA